MCKHLAVFLALSLTIFAPSALGADIRFQKGPKGWETETAVVISGEIVEGDFEKFIAAALDAGTKPGRVFIASPGGSVSEAMKIGVLIRELGWVTQVPEHFVLDHPPQCGRYEVAECTCVSACFLIFVAGVERSGNFIQVHRTFLDREVLLRMSITQAAEYSNALNAHVRQYLDHMSSPPSLNEIMESIASNTAITLDNAYVHQNFWGPAANVEEWVIARCGNYETATDKHLAARTKEEKERTQAILTDAYNCKSDAFEGERNRVFTAAIKQALDNADERFLTDELRNYRELAAVFSVENFVGQALEDTKIGLKLLGFGEDSARVVAGTPEDAADWALDDNFHIEINDREVTAVTLYFRDEKPYMRHFLGDLSTDADLQSVEAILGEPWRSQRSGQYDIRTKKSDVLVSFNDESGTIRIIQFREHWPLPYYPKLD